ncbi:DUF1499 domain-containing protein [Fibrobacterota bacterium]
MFIPQCTGTRPSHVAEGHGKLAPCPETPNCVSTKSTDEQHKIEPLTYSTDTKIAMSTLVDVIHAMKRTEIVAQTENYLYAEFTSGFWRFVDDVEFSFDEENKIIHFRSASRLGKSDFGVNRERMEEIRKLFTEKMKRKKEALNE